MKKKFTYEGIKAWDSVATQYLIRNGYYNNATNETATSPAKAAGFTNKENTKLTSNMRNIIKQIGKHYQAYNERIDDLQIDFCAVDEKTHTILLDEKGNRKFTVEKLKEYKQAVKKLDQEEVDIHVRITEGVKMDELMDEEIEYFSGVIIPEPDEKSAEN